jgi:hypothetical protein
MRLYALLLGVALTSGYGYAADVAVASRKPVAPKPAAPKGPVWLGGVLDPVTVEVRGGVVRTTTPSHDRGLDRTTLQCHGTSHSSSITIS